MKKQLPGCRTPLTFCPPILIMASGQHLSHLEEHKIEGSNIELFGTEVTTLLA